MYRLLIVAVLSALAFGCGPAKDKANSSDTSKNGNQSSNANSLLPVEEPVPADAYAGVPQAIEAMEKAIADEDQKERYRTYKWLAMQGGTAVPPLAELLKDDAVDLELKIAACQALGRVGAPAKSTLVEALSNDEQFVRLNAIKELSKLKPQSEDVIRAIVAALANPDQRTRVEAVRALKSFGPRAKDLAEDRLVAIMRSDDDRALVDEIGKALKVINPGRAAGVFDE